jgi:mRNA interferase MazF
MNIKRGDIFYISKISHPTIGHEQHPGRPAVVITNNKANQYSPVIQVIWLTTSPDHNLPTHVEITSSKKPSIALCEQIIPVDVSRLGDYMGHCTDEEMAAIEDAIALNLDLPAYATDSDTTNQPTGFEYKGETIIPDKELTLQLLIERDMHKKLYDELLNKIMNK